MNRDTALNNYQYLDILDRAWRELGIAKLAGGALCDVGCASFWYAAALQSFFRPASMVGVDVEGHRLFRDGRTRIDYAAGYLSQVPNARFVVADYATYEAPADIITAWFPFVAPGAVLAWRLPLTLLKPKALLDQIRHNLRADGRFVMVNHGPEEAHIAMELCDAAEFISLGRWVELEPLRGERRQPPIVSCWAHKTRGSREAPIIRV